MAIKPEILISTKAIIQMPDKDRSLLIAQRHSSSKFHPLGWEFIGGKVDSGEDPNEALSREIAEETGWHIDKSEFTPLRDTPFVHEFAEKGKNILHEVHFSIIKLGQIMLANPKLMLSDSHIDFRYVKPKEVKNYKLPSLHSKAFKYALQSGLL